MSGNGGGVDIRSVIRAVSNILRRGKKKGARNYIAELTWLLFLRMLDEREERQQAESASVGGSFRPTLSAPYRWRDWASPESGHRRKLAESDGLLDFVRTDLFPHLRGLKDDLDAGVRQRVVSQIFIGVGSPRMDEQTGLLNILDRVHQLRESELDTRHDFPLSRVYEDLLLDMGQKGKDAGQFFTPREVIRAMLRVVNPLPRETILDPCCGTGGFLAQAREHILAENPNLGGRDMTRLKEETLYGREQEEEIYPLALANLIMHGVDRPNIWHGDTLTKTADYDGLFEGAPEFYDVILTNPPFGATVSEGAQTRYGIRTSSSQVLFAREMMRSLKDGGRCGAVFDEGFMFGGNDSALVATRRMLLEQCDLWCVVSLPPKVFVGVGAGVKTNLLFFRKGGRTRRTWYYDLSGVNVTKGNPLTLGHFADFFRKYPGREEGESSWVVDFEARRALARDNARPHMEAAKKRRGEARRLKIRMSGVRGAARAELREKRLAAERMAKESEEEAKKIMDAACDLRAANPNRKTETDTRTPEELLGIVSAKNREIAKLLAELK